ncbi:MAG: ATP-binding protein, partial [Xanthomonadales bacterium]|nr:ATP-binding protein [Xanthomonadales bacterium]
MVEMRNSLKFKVGLSLVVALAITVFIFAMMVVHNNREELLQQVTKNSAQLSRVVMSSTRFAMLQNQPSHVSEIIQDVGDQQDIEKVRILSKEGVIIHSSVKAEIGNRVDQEAEACLACHLDEKSLRESPMVGRSRFFSNENGRRMLGSTAVIHNEPSCAGAGCHMSVKEQPVLGVLDIIYPLDEIEKTMLTNTFTVFGLSIGFILLAGLLVGYLVNRTIYLPLRDLDDGAERLAAGDLENSIPVRSKDEFGHLANSFNSMTRALRKSRVELEDWGRTLEQKVEKATQELHKAQAETARSEKLASVGLLAAGIAHELNNPLTGVLTFSYLVRKNLPDDSPDAEDLDLVIRETKRCAGIIRRLLDFSREKTPEKTFCDLNILITETVQLIAQAAQLKDIEISMDLYDQLPAAWIDENLVKQVIMNMLVNAQHAIENNGRITIRTRLRAASDRSENIAEPQDMAEIIITDSGCGIPPDDLQRIFDPFFTTKEVGKGTGLGLSVSHGTIEAHGGTIEVESTVGKGTEFR